MRFFSGPANYINMIVNILKIVWPFMCFMLLVTIAFGHAMFILLSDPKAVGLDPNGNNFVINTKNNANNDLGDYTISQDFNLSDPLDNYYVSLPYSIMAVFFWILGRWDQLEEWNFWPIYVLTIVAGILLVIIMQNMFTSFMAGVF
ncbi:hypothetical protein C1645_751253, partial [Glomus cerebriforme]